VGLRLPSSSPPSTARSPKASKARARKPRGGGSEALPDRFFRHLVLNLRNGVLAITRDSRIAAMNSIAYQVLGLLPDPDDIGRPYTEVLRDCPEVVRVLDSAFETSNLPNRAELRLRKTGRAIGYTISKIHDDAHKEVGRTLFLKDLTRVEQIEER
jgi:PAS domain-containing protein